MNLLIVLSCQDFDNFTRRATVEAICKEHRHTTLLFFTGIKGFPIKKPSIKSVNWRHYCSLSLGKGEKYLHKAELMLTRLLWKPFFRRFDAIFLTDPNQSLLLHFIDQNQKLFYLIRDPNVLLSKKHYPREEKILKRNPHVFGISKALCKEYLETYYPDLKIDKYTHWPNTADLNIWDHKKYPKTSKDNKPPIIGVSGNLTHWLDFELLSYLVQNNPDYMFNIYGKNELKRDCLSQFNKILEFQNIKYFGWVPFEKMPEIVSQWQVGMVLGRKNTEFSNYWGNNKIYQYTALGKPFVSYNHNDGYEIFGESAFLAENKDEFSKKLREAVKRSMNPGFAIYCIERARENSNETRAKQFLNAIGIMQKD